MNQLGERCKNMVLVFDGHKAHYQPAEILRRAGIVVLKQPPATPALNPIEQSWSILKRHWKKEVLDQDGYLNQDRIHQTLIRIIDTHLNGKSKIMASSGIR